MMKLDQNTRNHAQLNILKSRYELAIHIDGQADAYERLFQNEELAGKENMFPVEAEGCYSEYLKQQLMPKVVTDDEARDELYQSLTAEGIKEQVQKQGCQNGEMTIVMANFLLNHELRYCQLDIYVQDAEAQQYIMLVEDYTQAQNIVFVQTLKSINSRAMLFKLQNDDVHYYPVFGTESLAAMLHASMDEMMVLEGQGIRHAIHPDDVERVHAAIHANEDTSFETILQYRMRTQEDDYISVRNHLSFLKVGNDMYMYCTYDDITEELRQVDYRNKSVLAALAQEYVSVIALDVQTGQFRPYKLHTGTDAAIVDAMEAQDYKQSQEATVKTLVDPAYWEQFREMTDLDYIKARLQEVPNYTFTFLSKYGRYVEFKVVRADDSQEGEPESVLIGYADRDKITREQIADREEREQYYKLMEAFSEEYNSLYYVELDEDRATVLRLYDEDMRGKVPPASYKEIYRMAIDTVVAPEDKEEMILTGDPDYIRETLAHKQSFVTVYQTLVEGKLTFCEKKTIKLDGLDERPTRLIVGYAERETEIGMRYISEQLAREYDYVAYWNVPESKLRVFTVDETDTIRATQEDYDYAMAKFRENVHPAYREELENLTQTETMTRLLAESDRYEFNCRAMDTEQPWRRILARVVVRDEQGIPQNVIISVMALSDLQAEKMALSEKVAEQNQALKVQSEQLQAALNLAHEESEAKTNFLSNMSHDIRTPMNAIIGFTNMALNHHESMEQVEDYLRKIGYASEQLLALINDVLDMSKIESGKVEIHEAPVSLSALGDNLHSILATTAAEKDIYFTLDSSGVEHDVVLCDRQYMNRVMINILSNSIKFTESGGHVKVTIAEGGPLAAVFAGNQARREEPDAVSDGERCSYYFSIQDDGIGMSAEFLERIFEPFERERTSTVSQQQGTGLGMAIVKKLVDHMGGRIHIDSAPGQGTHTIIEMPLKISDEKVARIVDSKTLEGLNFDGKHVLLVDDMAVNQEIARMLLEDAGFQVDVASNGQEAVDTFAAHQDRYDVVLMDIQMPVMNGLEATEAIRALDLKEAGSVPILAMTANAFAEDRVKSIKAGMNDHIIKPINAPQLFKTLAKFLK